MVRLYPVVVQSHSGGKRQPLSWQLYQLLDIFKSVKMQEPGPLLGNPHSRDTRGHIMKVNIALAIYVPVSGHLLACANQ